MTGGTLAAMIWRATVEAVEDSGALQKLTLGGFLGKGRTAERLQQYGLTSVPLKDSEALVFQVNGDSSCLVVSVVDCSAHRPTDLQPGEVCLYTDEGDRIHFKRGNEINVRSTGKVVVDAPNVHLGGDGGDDVVRKGDLQDVVDAYNLHVHDVALELSPGTFAPSLPTTSTATAGASSKVHAQ